MASRFRSKKESKTLIPCTCLFSEKSGPHGRKGGEKGGKTCEKKGGQQMYSKRYSRNYFHASLNQGTRRLCTSPSRGAERGYAWGIVGVILVTGYERASSHVLIVFSMMMVVTRVKDRFLALGGKRKADSGIARVDLDDWLWELSEELVHLADLFGMGTWPLLGPTKR